ncbi:MAG: type II secretion system F family protein [Gammaproteobacteria bacterium]
MAIEIKPTPQNGTTSVREPKLLSKSVKSRKSSNRDRMLFTERLSILLETGVPLHSALEILHDQELNPETRATLNDILQDVSAGNNFSSAIKKHPKLFPNSHVNLIAASEKGGFMPEVLQQLIEMDEKNEQLRTMIRSALFYPAFLVLFSIIVVIFVLVGIFPKFADMFDAIRDRLPFTTIILMSLSDIIKQHWLILLVITGGSGFCAWRWFHSTQGRRQMDRLKLSIPKIRDIFVQVYLIQITRIMGLSLDNGVTIIETLNSTRNIVNNSVIMKFIDNVEQQVTEGRGISTGFNDAEFIPVILKQMISTGEATGNLSTVLQRSANYYENELSKKITTLTKMIEPVMLIVMGGLVGVIVSSLILPIFKLSGAVH